MSKGSKKQTFSDNSVWHPFTSYPLTTPPAQIVRAEGAFVYDEGGKRLYDATSSWWCNIHGHCHPRLVEALCKQARILDQVMFAPHGHPVALELASGLLEVLGEPFERVFFSDDGSTAVEAALKMAIQFWQLKGKPEKSRFLSMERAYHGDTMGAVSVSHLSQFHSAFEGIRIPVVRATAPYCYRCPLNLTYPSCQVRCLDETLKTIEKEASTLAAVIVEPLILGAGGMVAYPKEYLEKLVAACEANDILVIYDEVFTGFGRTGTMFAMEQLSRRPDIVCLSKGLTSGMMPLAVTVVTSRVFDAFSGGIEKTFYHGHTFTANALSCAIAVESLRIFESEGVLERNKKLTAVMRRWTPRFTDLEQVGDVRHLGMVWALEVVKDKVTKECYSPANGPGWKIAKRLWNEGFWIRPLNQVLYVIPPYCTTETDLQDFFTVLYSALQNEPL